MDYRVEKKYLVTEADIALLTARLKVVMSQDIHQKSDCYEIRSLYFDDAWDHCMAENESGVDEREKYRIRIYDAKTSVIHLEIKEKTRNLTRKYVCDLSEEECLQIMDHSLPLSIDNRKPLNRLQMLHRCCGMIPKVIISYERTAFVYPAGNVRITFDRNIEASNFCDEFLCENVSGVVPVLPTGVHVLEVKYDEFLPDVIAEQLEIGKLHQVAFSKYYLGRLAIQGEHPISL